MRVGGLIALALSAAALLWLMRTPPRAKPLYPIVASPSAPMFLGERFDPARTGRLEVITTWSGSPPAVPCLPLFQARLRPGGQLTLPNPNAPRIGPDGALADVLVRLVDVPLELSRPWDLAAVRVEVDDHRITVRQGTHPGRMGVVRRGAEVELHALTDTMHSVRARGAAFFTQMLFISDRPVRRLFSDPGWVELSSGSGFFWHRAYLAVSDHPYVGITDDRGRVHFDHVPQGAYTLECWMPNWHIRQIDRDPEWLLQSSLEYAPPAIKAGRVTIRPGEMATVELSFAMPDFPTGRSNGGANQRSSP